MNRKKPTEENPVAFPKRGEVYYVNFYPTVGVETVHCIIRDILLYCCAQTALHADLDIMQPHKYNNINDMHRVVSLNA